MPSLLIFITNDEIELRPLLSPEESLKMGKINQVIFMSATLPDEELLHKIFGIRRYQVHMVDERALTAETLNQTETMGKRLIFPLDQTELGARVSQKCLDLIVRLIDAHKKVLILANSFYDTLAIKAFLDYKQVPTLIFKTENDSEYFANKMSSGVLLCANRYLGLDFPGETCKVEVVVRLPAIWDSIDAFQQTVLRNDLYADQRIGNRLIQSFGRCNRLENDEALYYILDSRILARFTGNEGFLRYMPRNMYAELMTGYALSQGGNIEQALDYGIKSFFGKKDESYEKILKEEKEMWTPQEIKTFIGKYDLEIEAWENALVGSYENAGQLLDYVGTNFRENSDAYPDQNLKMTAAFDFYLSAMFYHNAFIFHGNAKNKQLCADALKKAIDNGGNSSWFNHLRAVYNSIVENESEKLSFDSLRIEVRQGKEDIAERYDDFINSNSSKNKNWKDVLNQLIDDLSKGSHGQMHVALRQCFELMGFDVFLGDNAKGEPDLLAVSPLSSWKYQVSVETKSKEKGNEEGVESVTQAMGDATIVKKKSNSEVFAVLLTQKDTFSLKAIEMAKSNVRIIPARLFGTLMNNILKSIDDWSNLSPSGKPQFIDSIISSYEIKQLFIASETPVLTTEDIHRII